MRRGGKVVHWTLTELLVLGQMARDRCTAKEIAAALETRSPSAVIAKAHSLDIKLEPAKPDNTKTDNNGGRGYGVRRIPLCNVAEAFAGQSFAAHNVKVREGTPLRLARPAQVRGASCLVDT